MPVLEVKRLKKSFGQTAVLKGIDFSIEQGQALSIIGPSGSGKTTLLRCLNFLELADGGTISVNGAVIYRGGDSKKHSDAEIRKKRLHFGLVFRILTFFRSIRRSKTSPSRERCSRASAPTTARTE